VNVPTKGHGPRDILTKMFDAALAAAHPATCLPPHLPAPPKGRTIVVGAGKAAAAMAKAVEDNWPEDAPLEGLVTTRYGSRLPCERIDVVEADHPVPDQAGADAAARMLDLVSDLTADDMVLALISGGGSALLTLPAPGISLADKQAVTDALLSSGAPIQDINCVRKHLSAIKGGRLTRAAAPAQVVALLISDVVGDDSSVIASGPTVADPTTTEDALVVLKRFKIDTPTSIRRHLVSGTDESPKPGDPIFANTTTRLIATPSMSLDAAAKIAEAAGYNVEMLGDAVEGEARDVAYNHARFLVETPPDTVVLSGGELTVTKQGNGKGGPNGEYGLALALALTVTLDANKNIHALAADTDGIDGSGDNAGVFIDPDTLTRAQTANLDARTFLDANDSYGFFSALGDLFITGPTHTNVNDFRAIIVGNGVA